MVQAKPLSDEQIEYYRQCLATTDYTVNGPIVNAFIATIDGLKQKLEAEKLRAHALHEALSELVDGIEGAGGHDENGDVFDIGKAVAALALARKEQL